MHFRFYQSYEIQLSDVFLIFICLQRSFVSCLDYETVQSRKDLHLEATTFVFYVIFYICLSEMMHLTFNLNKLHLYFNNISH